MSPNLPMMVNPGSNRLTQKRTSPQREDEKSGLDGEGPAQNQEQKEQILKELEGASDDFMTEEDRKDKWYNEFKNKQAGNSNQRQPGSFAPNKNNSQTLLNTNPTTKKMTSSPELPRIPSGCQVRPGSRRSHFREMDSKNF